MCYLYTVLLIHFKLWLLSRDNSNPLNDYAFNEFHICNMKWRNHCLAKWGEGDEQTGTYENARDTWYIIPASKWNEWRIRGWLAIIGPEWE